VTLYQISVPDTNVLTSKHKNTEMLPPAPIFGKVVDENQAGLGAHNEKRREM
jgi:hypothetical protein